MWRIYKLLLFLERMIFFMVPELHVISKAMLILMALTLGPIALYWRFIEKNPKEFEFHERLIAWTCVFGIVAGFVLGPVHGAISILFLIPACICGMIRRGEEDPISLVGRCLFLVIPVFAVLDNMFLGKVGMHHLQELVRILLS